MPLWGSSRARTLAFFCAAFARSPRLRESCIRVLYIILMFGIRMKQWQYLSPRISAKTSLRESLRVSAQLPQANAQNKCQDPGSRNSLVPLILLLLLLLSLSLLIYVCVYMYIYVYIYIYIYIYNILLLLIIIIMIIMPLASREGIARAMRPEGGTRRGRQRQRSNASTGVCDKRKSPPDEKAVVYRS